ncbi:hypothetical protein TraAM80_01373 [Trypanosoma rangeli]|uniref:Uncharacterized protein n=1 Tax=Trypanosoma rangeli TaxID=5698 RepID=A0A3R7M850_TRYRA|nr:uncharacterized protein TraAM80_01373 [Trypanosoma rangeli]RNF10828.1 hypothetical protein TraAM80_01373 [Trypanosoma rangeli]|eukprot:RNF10828.1 hypothetical protein TraAM80_01373 [Trypanosoma rangeli]
MEVTGRTTAGESPSLMQLGSTPHATPLESCLLASPVGTALKLPAVGQKVGSEGWGRGGRLRHNKTRPNAFQEGEVALLFLDDSTEGKRNVTMTDCEDRIGDTRRQTLLKASLERRAREPAATFVTPLTLRPQSVTSQHMLRTSPSGTPKMDNAGTGVDFLLTCSDACRTSGQQRGRRVIKNVVEYDPKSYSELLPATLKMRKVRDVESGTVSSTAVSEMFAKRDARHTNRGVSSMNDKKAQRVPLVELQEFVRTMNQLQERGRHMRRRWRRYMPCVTAVSGGAVRMLNEDDDDTSSEGLQDHNSDGEFNLTLSKRQQPKTEATRASIFSWHEEMNALQKHGDNTRGAVLLRSELKKSQREVAKARQGVTVASVQMIHNEPTRYKDADEEEQGELWEEPPHSSLEDISWRAENEVSQRVAAIPSDVPPASGALKEAEDCGNTHSNREKSQDNTIVAGCISPRLGSLLHRGKGTTVYGLNLGRKRGSCKTQFPHLRPKSPLSSLPHVPGLPFAMSTPAPLPSDAKPKAERNACRTHHHTTLTWRPLPVEHGVGEQSSLRFKAQVTQGRLEDCQSDILDGEAILRTRELLLELRPTRAALLNESLKHSHRNARAILQQHRQCIFEKVAEKDSEKRKEACLEYVNLLEQAYCGEVAESSLAAVTSALQSVRNLISVSPKRCNARSYSALLMDHFVMAHLTELPVRDLLWRLAELFDMTTTQYNYALWNAYQMLNTPRDYQARFREIDHTIVGIPAPVERRVRLTLHRCRFLQANASVGTAHIVSGTGGERVRDLAEVSVQIKSEHQVFLSTAVRARVCSDEELFSWNVSRRDEKSPSLCGANFMDQVFRLQLCENTELWVGLLHNGLVMASGKFSLSDCTFNVRGLALLWLRLSGGEAAEAEIKLTLALLGEKHPHKKALRK